ncbi:IspD/TarI family cytidylyltransferase [Latilactobacillus curvatus]|uniref:IspD/TarI family cytidylyltransferase n=1 Tax=Latilactobacillus curvatus TaxID=28038 RepID=UPI0024100321|nr:2-C-methyl-D-erythritol 4-phosphate cytidylyltransferase [Latilactobacillus curvatus]MDG2982025.1 2-C-methyl-D-erythritol 4-phosphate cytidylyltransferase [Latilactobacillus curvatus]MDT3394790.1 2-C-methyl-D-erythritol 4-phosphate cytidylyltransferase [Bacillota bacterium]
MIYAEILAGGKGTRMGNTPLPKQFLNLSGKPIIIHTIEKFLLHSEFEKIVVVLSSDWINYTNDLLKKSFTDQEISRIALVKGGKDRNQTLMNGLNYIVNEYDLAENDVVVTHDAVRPFVSRRIIKENIEYAVKYGAVDTVVPSIDTIVKSDSDGEYIQSIPNRSVMYQGQTPQSFNINLLMNACKELSDDNKLILTDAAKIVVLSGENVKVKLVEGEQQNFKITTSFDFKLAEALIDDGGDY